MKARNKFLFGAFAIVGTVSYLMFTGIKMTAVYSLTPSELIDRVSVDRSFHEVGVKLEGNVIPGTIEHDVGTQTYAFRITDGSAEMPVVYVGLAPDTFVDSSEVFLDGKLDATGVFRATTLTAKCGSRFEAVPTEEHYTSDDYGEGELENPHEAEQRSTT